ncbi:YciI family protein [Pelagibacterium limicola]|uniref:YciI family protein n=1 Tax=Pelagibacterium limicola TaxID=2791022 RepID=UPI0018AF5842|nr:YciI family protein [Pelagibacterium limicola]
MLYAILCYNDEAEVAAWSKDYDDKVMGDLIAVQRPMAEKGKLGPVARLLPTTAATTIRKTAGEPLVLDGPFAETKEQFLGFYVVDCENLEEVVQFVRELCAVNPGSGSYEIRPVGFFNQGTKSA